MKTIEIESTQHGEWTFIETNGSVMACRFGDDDRFVFNLDGDTQLTEALAHASLSIWHQGRKRGEKLGYDQKCHEIKRALCLT